MSRVATAQVAHQNPIASTSKDFDTSRGIELLRFSRHTYIGGAVAVLAARADIELLPIYAAGGPSAGVLEHASFLSSAHLTPPSPASLAAAPFLLTDGHRYGLAVAEELLSGVRTVAAEPGGVDGVYFSMHGAMATFEEHDPEVIYSQSLT